MKGLILASVMACMGLAASAQDVNPMRLQVRVGVANPIKSFGNTGIHSEKAGYALPGPTVTLGLSTDLHPYFGAGITAGWRNNPFDAEAQAKVMGADTYDSYRAEATPWQSLYLTADGIAQLAVGNVTFYAKGSLGLAQVTSPWVLVEVESVATSRRTAEQQEAKAFAPIYGLAGGLRYDFGRIGVKVEASWLSTRPEIQTEFSDGRQVTFKQAMATVDTTVGLSYRFR